MPNQYLREAILRELRLHRATVDQIAAYLLRVQEFVNDAVELLCPRCYVEGVSVVLEITNRLLLQVAICPRCAAVLKWRMA